MEKWIKVAEKNPPEGIAVKTKIHDNKYERNVAILIFCNNLWCLSDMSMYVYYQPTHWKYI